MKPFLPSVWALCSVVLACSALAQGNQPVVEQPIKDVTVPLGASQAVVKLDGTFALNGVTGPVVRFDTVSGPIDVELLPDDAPATVANFLNYVNRGAYNGTFFHRSVSGFVIQSGGYTFADNTVKTIAKDPPVVNEFKVSNTRGTLAMAKIGGDPNSATDEFFINEVDNSANLDNQNGGFTVFGRVIDTGLPIVDAIAALPVTNAGGVFNSLPVIDYTGGQVMQPNLVTIRTISEIPLLAKNTNSPGLLKLKIKANSNPELVESYQIKGSKLKLKLKSGVKGVATITVKAKNAAGKASTNFTLSVE